ncbi:hypothetical protein GSI_09356 [Ganoderma sinense ZZ0214-1]|uniref:Uncharacterized protein n=1 Tax=Ganoderma sinense ZZ0214-1 TaxID=1077348 RepID=A0A2G8S6D0_9APHY|nr:hypothetical protein GSI_09356 [Ganoderma sinense ZZ0214-1]
MFSYSMFATLHIFIQVNIETIHAEYFLMPVSTLAFVFEFEDTVTEKLKPAVQPLLVARHGRSPQDPNRKTAHA